MPVRPRRIPIGIAAVVRLGAVFEFVQFGRVARRKLRNPIFGKRALTFLPSFLLRFFFYKEPVTHVTHVTHVTVTCSMFLLADSVFLSAIGFGLFDDANDLRVAQAGRPHGCDRQSHGTPA